MAASLGVHKSTASRLAGVLERAGLLTRSGRRFRLGLEVIRLGTLALRSLDFVASMQPVMEKLSQLTGETVNLAVPDGGHVLNVAEVPSTYILNSSGGWIGRRTAPHAVANGKVLLAYGAIPVPAELERYTARHDHHALRARPRHWPRSGATATPPRSPSLRRGWSRSRRRCSTAPGRAWRRCPSPGLRSGCGRSPWTTSAACARARDGLTRPWLDVRHAPNVSRCPTTRPDTREDHAGAPAVPRRRLARRRRGHGRGDQPLVRRDVRHGGRGQPGRRGRRRARGGGRLARVGRRVPVRARPLVRADRGRDRGAGARSWPGR